jgi:hypothetical protein
MSSVAQQTTSILERVRPIYYKQAFFLAVFGYILLMMVDAQSYGPTVRLFPMLVGIPLLGLLLLQLIFPALPSEWGGRGGGIMSVVNDEEIETGDPKSDRSIRMRREFWMVGWTIGLLAIMYLFGFLAGMTVFVSAFIYYYERDLVLSVGVMAINLVVSYLLFVQILQLRLFPGVIWS